MSQEDTVPEQQDLVVNKRPDPLFKALTEREAGKVGIRADSTEAVYSTLADLTLLVPSDTSLEGTPFDFFRLITVLEFKSQHDKLDLTEYVKNEIRTAIEFIHQKAVNYQNILNLIVTARFPERFFKEAQQEGLVFQRLPGQPWIWQAHVGLQDVLVVVCRDLPLEEPLHPWLIFAPTDSRKWADFLVLLFSQNNSEMLGQVANIRPKEYEAMVKKLEEELDLLEYAQHRGLLTPEEEDFVMAERAEALQEMLRNSARWKRRRPNDLPRALSVLTPEDRLANMTPEQIAAGLEPQRFQELMKLYQAQQKQDETDQNGQDEQNEKK